MKSVEFNLAEHRQPGAESLQRDYKIKIGAKLTKGQGGRLA
jgi:hypothetical protein